MDDQTKRKHLAHVHGVARDLDLEPGGDAYRAWLKRRTGCESCKDLTDEQLAALSDALKATHAQWKKAKILILELGYSGFEDQRFCTIVKRVTKEDDARLLSKPQLGKVIGILDKTAADRRKRATAAAAVDPAGPAAG